MRSSLPCLALLLSLSAAAQSLTLPTPARQRELIRMVRQDCGSCHGMTLKGGLGSPLLPENLRDKPAEGLAATVLHGRSGTAMPPWKSKLGDVEAAWIVDQLISGFPSE